MLMLYPNGHLKIDSSTKTNDLLVPVLMLIHFRLNSIYRAKGQEEHR